MVSQGDNIFSSILTETRGVGNIEETRKGVTSHIQVDQEKQKERYDKNKVASKKYNLGDLV